MQGSPRGRPQALAVPEDDPHWSAVREWPGLSAEAKLAWRMLYLDAGSVERLVTTSPAAIGQNQGKSETSGRRDFRALVAHDLIRVVDRRQGRWECLLENPLDVRRARLARESAAQGELFDRHDVESAAADEARSSLTVSGSGGREAAAPIILRDASADASAGGSVVSAAARLNLPSSASLLPSPSKRSALKAQRAVTERKEGLRETNASADGSVANDRELARRLEAIMGPLPDMAAQERWIEDAAAYVSDRVGDPALHASIPRNIAIAICYGQFELPALYQVLGYVDRTVAAGKLKANSPWCLFYGCMKQRFKAKGLQL